MAFIFDKQLRKEFDLEKALLGHKVVDRMGHPVQILLIPDGVHHNSAVVFKWAQMDVRGKVMNWYVSTATKDGLCQLGGDNNLFLYDGDIDLEQSDTEIW